MDLKKIFLKILKKSHNTINNHPNYKRLIVNKSLMQFQKI